MNKCTFTEDPVTFFRFPSTFHQNFARENQESVAELLVEFFRYFAWNFDFRQKVVSIRQSGNLSKLDKAEQHGWLQSDILRYVLGLLFYYSYSYSF